MSEINTSVSSLFFISMKYIFSILAILFLFSTAFGQSKKRGKVKRKYRNTETVSKKLQPVYLRGEIYDVDKNPVAGARITIDGTKKVVHTNSFGEFFIKNLQTGKARIRVVFAGYKIKTTDIILRAGKNYKKIMLAEERFHFEPEMVTAQKREQQITDVPLAISSVTAETIGQLNITELNQLGEFVPGLLVSGNLNSPGYTIRGITNDVTGMNYQSRVAVLTNNVPVNQVVPAQIELFDIERVEVLKGPQNTLFGRDAEAGAIHFISKKPENSLNGYVSAGVGNFAQKEVRAAVNIPVIEDILFVRAAGIYFARDGFVSNTFGGALNGKNTQAGRLSIRLLPAYNHTFDLVMNYQKNDAPGIALMSKIFPNTNGVTGIFSGTASLEEGENLSAGKEFLDGTLHYNYYISELNYLSSVSLYQKGNYALRYDGDGSAAAAIDISESGNLEQLFQEIKLNFSRNSKINGSLGSSYRRVKTEQSQLFSSNEQHTFHLFANPLNLVLPDGQPFSVATVPNTPEFGVAAGMPLPIDHREERQILATNQSIELFFDGTVQLSRKFSFSGGARGMFDINKLTEKALFVDGQESTLGLLTENSPNLIFKPSAGRDINKNTISVTGHAGLQFKINDETNIFVNYSRGQRPNVLQFNAAGKEEVVDAETLNNYEGGLKSSFLSRIFIGATGFYQQYRNFQTGEWAVVSDLKKFEYKVNNAGKATMYGIESDIKVAVVKQLDVFANYTWLVAAFDSVNTNGATQKYAGNSLRLSPGHSFTFGFNARANIADNLKLFISPSYSYKSDFYFDDANTPDMKQPGYGLLDINGGLELSDPNVILSVFGTNLLNEQFVLDTGNSSEMFGIATFVPGAPRMFGAKLTWIF